MAAIQSPGRTGPVTNNAAAFGPEMVQGCTMPPLRSPRALFPFVAKYGWFTAQTTHVQATFQPNMSAGYEPDRNREMLPLRTGRIATPPDVDRFSVEMSQGWRPDEPRIFLAPRIPLPWSQTTHTENAFGQDMVEGYQPERNRAFVFPKLGDLDSQTTHVPAAFNQDMVEGSTPDRNRASIFPKLGGQFVPPDVALFSIDMVIGARPDLPRLFLAPRFQQPPTQTTHVQNAFSPDMVDGWLPDRNRAFVYPRLGWQSVAPEVLPFSVEMVQGWRPDSPRIFLAPRFIQPPTQTTHVQATFTPDMVQGSRPDKNRERTLLVRIGTQRWAVEVDPFSIDMVVGSRPDRPRIFLAPRIPLPVSQTTHVAAPFGYEMVQGSTPDRNRERLWRLIVLSLGNVAIPGHVDPDRLSVLLSEVLRATFDPTDPFDAFRATFDPTNPYRGTTN